uniref:Uncharacterized protein n=1 Tax=Anguilla anguilla TaxID=7936 RepID=A0A0E9T0T1_ANGAN
MKEPSSDASDTETQSQYTEGKDGSEVIPEKLFSPEEEYYTHQRIAEWVLKVNASLFSPSSESMMTISPGEEQDTAIKIVYEGD